MKSKKAARASLISVPNQSLESFLTHRTEMMISPQHNSLRFTNLEAIQPELDTYAHATKHSSKKEKQYYLDDVVFGRCSSLGSDVV